MPVSIGSESSLDTEAKKLNRQCVIYNCLPYSLEFGHIVDFDKHLMAI
jgi:hypothetical protein